jgi:sulfoxide reductase heme-binding subunit YedZ
MKLFRDRIAALKPLLFAACLMPLTWLIWDALRDGLGADPVAQLEHRSGDWALRLLLVTLAITPLRRLAGRAELVRFRRMLGMFAFFYACVHLAIYVLIDLGAYWSELFADVVKRPYITVGFAAWLLLIPLAVTSTRGMMRRLGRHWQRLHRLVYVIALLAVLHFLWLVKADHREPLVYLAILALLMLARVRWVKRPVDLRRRKKRDHGAAMAAPVLASSRDVRT